MSKIVTQGILWGWVLSASILIGGGIFEHVVLSPMWQHSPPESVTSWSYGSPQGRFFTVVTPLYGFLSIALLIASFWMPRRQRLLAAIAGITGIIAVVWTFLYFLPVLQKTQMTRGAGLSGEEITALVSSFRSWNYLRYVDLIGGWIAGLLAFSRSSRAGDDL